jgi:two-component system cell cycle sensor histidine kinase/response regulator CckA
MSSNGTRTDDARSPYRGLLEIDHLARTGSNLASTLREIARTIGETAGFRTVAINLHRPAWDDFEVIAVHGNPAAKEALLGGLHSRASWNRLLDERFAHAGTYLVRQGDFDWASTDGAVYTPDLPVSEDARAWHPEDALFVPLLSSKDELLGVISVDEPLSGLWPDDDELAVLAAAGIAAGRAVEGAQESREKERIRRALEELVRVSAGFHSAASPDEILDAVCRGINSSLGFEKVSAQILDTDNGVFVARAAAGWDPDSLPVHTSLSPENAERLVQPALLRSGCTLLSREQAIELIGGDHADYPSVRNGSGSRAWQRHWLVVPLFSRRQEMLGFLWADDPEDSLLPSDERLQTLRMFADQAARALDSAEQVRTLSLRNEEMAALHDSTLSVLGELHAAPTLELVVERACDLLGTAHGYVYLLDEDTDRMEVRVGTGELARYVGSTIKRSDGLSGRVWAEDRPLAVSDYLTWENRLQRYDDAAFQGIAGVPLHSRGRVVGVLGVAKRNVGQFGDEALELLERFGRLAELALEKGRLYEELGRSRELYRRVVESSNELISLTSPDGRLLYASPAFEAILGRDPKSLLGVHGVDLVHPDDLGRLHETHLPGATHVFRALHADGSWVSLEAVTSEIRDDAGELEMVLVTARDVTEQRRAEAERAALEEELRQAQKMEAVGRLAGGIAHDFNNLLTAITGYSEVALDRLNRGGVPRDEIGSIREAGLRAASLTRQLLAFSRKQMLDLHVLDLGEIVTDTAKMLGRVLGENVEIVLTFGPELGKTRADASQIAQVLLNLAINGRDAMPDGGTLMITTSNAGPGDPLFAAHPALPAGEYVRLTVEDTGTGMDEETLPRIFEPFFTTKGVGEGTGLGLSTVHGIVHQLDGQLWVESEPGCGARFEILLPRCADEAEYHVVPAERRPALGGSERVLLVEDEDIVRRLMETTLSEAGYEVLSAACAEDALNLLARDPRPVQALVTDVVMPGMSGPDLARVVQQRDERVRVLFTSGYAADKLPSLPNDAAFLAKPFSVPSLADQLRSLLDAA